MAAAPAAGKGCRRKGLPNHIGFIRVVLQTEPTEGTVGQWTVEEWQEWKKQVDESVAASPPEALVTERCESAADGSADASRNEFDGSADVSGCVYGSADAPGRAFDGSAGASERAFDASEPRRALLALRFHVVCDICFA